MASEVEIERMVVRLMGDALQYERTLRDAEKATKSFGKRVGETLQKVGQRLSSLGKQMTMRLTLPIVGAMGASVKAFASFDQAMTESLSIMRGVTDSQKKEMRDLARSMALESTKSAVDIASSYFYLASAGLDAQMAMDNMKTVMDFSVAGAFDMARATDILTDSMDAFKWATEDATLYQERMVKLSDAIALANQQANATMEQYGEAIMTDAGGAAAMYGMELETLMAVLGGYASASKKGAEGGNLMGRAIRLSTAAFMKQEKVWKGTFNIDMIDRATGEYKNFIDVIGEMEQAFAGMTGPEITKALDQMGLAALSQKAIIPLLGQSAKMRRWETEQLEAAGATAEIVAKQYESFSNQMKIGWNNVKEIGYAIGEILAPYILKLNGYLKQAQVWWSGLTTKVKEWYVIMLGIVAVIGPALVFIGGIIAVLGTAITVLAAVSWPVVAVIAGIGLAIVAAAIATYQWWDVIKRELGPAFTELGKVIKQEVIPLAVDLYEQIKELWNGSDGLAKSLKDNLVAVLKIIAFRIKRMAWELKVLMKVANFIAGSGAGKKLVTANAGAYDQYGKYDVYEDDVPSPTQIGTAQKKQATVTKRAMQRIPTSKIENIQATRFGGQEALSRIAAFKSAHGSIESEPDERTADATEEAVGLLQQVVENTGNLTTANLGGS